MEANVCVTTSMVKDALDQLRGAVMIVYPMGLPPYDPIRMEFENKEDLSGTQVSISFDLMIFIFLKKNIVLPGEMFGKCNWFIIYLFYLVSRLLCGIYIFYIVLYVYTKKSHFPLVISSLQENKFPFCLLPLGN